MNYCEFTIPSLNYLKAQREKSSFVHRKHSFYLQSPADGTCSRKNQSSLEDLENTNGDENGANNDANS